jgi:hypothetical protein
MAEYFEHGNKYSGSIKGGEFFGPSDHQFLKRTRSIEFVGAVLFSANGIQMMQR